ncbi:MAG TPA: hydroxypyruvate isomerase [Solibacterales bacterium]|nr:hydroxypyruvate isomerase [Bryobacterales bacterium]
MTRRSLLQASGAVALANQLAAADAPAEGRLKQSVSRWTYKNYSVDELCQHAVKIGLKGIDLVDSTDWPTIQKYGLTPSMTPGAGTIPHGFNRREHHDQLVQEMEANITKAAAAKVPNVITFSGNREGLPDAEGIENCVVGLNRCKRFAEEKGVTINMELLNSKVNHKDYQCDHTAWGVEVMKRVGSPRVKLLYDIYHMQIMEGDIVRTIRDNIAYLGHFHTGGVPGRHEIDQTQELNWRFVAQAIADLNFQGFIAHEFVPIAKDPIASLRQAYETCKV